MNYYILPTKRTCVNIKVSFSENTSYYVSDSYMRNIESLRYQVNEFVSYYNTIISKKTLDNIYKINKVYSYIYDVISKDVETYLTTFSLDNYLFFVVIEMYNTFDFIYTTINACTTNILYCGNSPNLFQSSIQYIHNAPPGLDTTKITSMSLDELFQHIYNRQSDELLSKSGFIFFDGDNDIDNCDTWSYVIYLLKSIYISIKSSTCCVIKIWDVTYKPVIDIIYTLTGVYKHVYVCKPTTTQYQNDRYIVCKEINNHYKILENKQELTNNIYSSIMYINDKLTSDKDFCNNMYIYSIIENSVSQHFINKIEESTLIVGQKNIEYYENLIVMLKLNGKEDKLEMAKKNSIIKCSQWCCKNNISIKALYS